MSRIIVDLSIPIQDGVDGVRVTRRSDPPVYEGYECHAWDLAVPSHTGTYFETASHLFRDGMSTRDFPPADLILPCRCLRVRHTRRVIDADDLNEAADSGQSSGDPPNGKWALLVETGERERDKHAYFSRNAATWMAERGVRIMGSNTPLYDNGFINPSGFFTELFSAEMAIVANLANLQQLPADEFELMVFPMSIEGVGTVPCRVAAALSCGYSAARSNR